MAENKQTEEQKKLEEKYGNLKLTLENEGDGYFFWGYGMPSGFEEDEEITKAFNEASKAVDGFKNLVEKRITDNGGDPENWEM